MAVTETTTESWTSRLGGAVKGVVAGLALFILGFPVLFWNEGNSVKTAKALDEGEGACIPVESNAKVDPEMEGRLVHMTGRADTQDVLTDEQFVQGSGDGPVVVGLAVGLDLQGGSLTFSLRDGNLGVGFGFLDLVLCTQGALDGCVLLVNHLAQGLRRGDLGGELLDNEALVVH